MTSYLYGMPTTTMCLEPVSTRLHKKVKTSQLNVFGLGLGFCFLFFCYNCPLKQIPLDTGKYSCFLTNNCNKRGKKNSKYSFLALIMYNIFPNCHINIWTLAPIAVPFHLSLFLRQRWIVRFCSQYIQLPARKQGVPNMH